MKWIKTRKEWLNEAKIKDVIFSRQAKEVANYWGEKYLDYEEVEPTDKIKQGRWKLSEVDKNKVLSYFFDCDMDFVTKTFKQLPDKFNHIIQESIDLDLLKGGAAIVMSGFNCQSPTIDQIIFIYENVFRKLDINQTRASEMIKKDESGRPVRDEEGNMIKIQKPAGSPVFTNNLVNINTFIEDYNNCFRESEIDSRVFSNRDFNQLKNLASENYNKDFEYEWEIFGKDMYLQIDHNPSDILNISISKFYASCQHLYTGGYREQLLSNVFDPNSIPAFFVFDTPILWEGEKISDKLPLSRMIIRNITELEDQISNPFEGGAENKAETKKETDIFFDRAYPDRMKDIFDEMVQKYSGNKQTYHLDDDDSKSYLFTPDIDPEDQLNQPYMDRLRIKSAKLIGKNTKSLYLSRFYDWSRTVISPGAKIKELVIETNEIPKNFSEIKLDLEWIKFKNLKINELKFNNIKTDSIAFDKCKFSTNIIKEIAQINPNVKRIAISGCHITDTLDLSSLKSLEELQLIYTLDSIDEVIESLRGIENLRHLTISGDVFDKRVISEIKKRGISVEIRGPKI